MGMVFGNSFNGRHFWIPPIPTQTKVALDSGLFLETVKQRSLPVNLKNHKDMVKIDAMFFTATEEAPTIYKSDDPENSPKFLSLNTFILCNPNAMSYQ